MRKILETKQILSNIRIMADFFFSCKFEMPTSMPPMHSKLLLLSKKGFLFLWPDLWHHAFVINHFSHVWLFTTLWTTAHQAPLSMGIFQARILEWVAMPSSRGSSSPKDQSHVSCSSCIAGGFFTAESQGSPTYETTFI